MTSAGAGESRRVAWNGCRRWAVPMVGAAVAAASIGVALMAQPAPGPAPQDVGSIDKARVEKGFPAKPPYSPYVGRSFPTQVYFGDTHLHTAISFDAGAFGTRLTPRDSYRFARGEEVVTSSGQPARLSRPLDFLVVADHSDNMGFFTDLMAGKPELLSHPTGRRWYDMIQSGQAKEAAWEILTAFGDGTFPVELRYSPGMRGFKTTWQQNIAAAEEYNAPGRFTAFIGYEWTSAPGGNNLHRNVIFRDNGDKASQVEPFTANPPGSSNPADLWKWMQAYEDKTGGSVLAIAHNGNMSNGLMFPTVESFGRPLDRAYAETRMRWERLYEATQTKGDGETHPFLSPNDEFADFEKWDRSSLGGAPKKQDMLQTEYLRQAYKNGLMLEQKLGANPYKFGLIGGTDSHTGMSSVEEDNFFGKMAVQEPSPERMQQTFFSDPRTPVKIMDWEVASAGFAGVWATENTREALWDAMQRRETYATTGTRMSVRFFGGWDFADADAGTRTPAAVGYGKGVPMGGELQRPAPGKTATFLVAALRDPQGANLDRIQIVKGWMDAKGQLQERVYDVAWSGGRKPGPDGKLPSVGSTVDLANATWTNTIGAPELIAVWKDPAFNAAERAFYYVRVLEIPTPRWTAYDAKRFGSKPLPETRMTVIERAYTSPIWYTP